MSSRPIPSSLAATACFAAALALLGAPRTILASQVQGSLLAEPQAGPDDAPAAINLDENAVPDPIHPWDNNDFSDTLDSGRPEPMRRLKLPPGDPGKLVIKSEVRRTGNSAVVPEQIEFMRNLPNPFNAQTRIEFALTQGGRATLEIYNLLGQPQNRMEWSHLDAGVHSWLWQGTSADGRSLPSGVYFYRLQVEQASSIGRMVLLK